jgi:hypothetical protein
MIKADWKGAPVIIKKYDQTKISIPEWVVAEEISRIINFRHFNVMKILGFDVSVPLFLIPFAMRGTLQDLLYGSSKEKLEV